MLVTKAPGKVILFGEHAVVYGQPAIAASVDLHTYLFVNPAPEGVVELDFPMVGLSKQWSIAEIPFVYAGVAGSQLDQKVVTSLQPLLSGLEDPFSRASAFAFLYLYVHICTPETRGMIYVARSTLPVGAGLGSSASFSVALAAALLEISSPSPSSPLASTSRDIINDWAYLGESCIHGNPSGIDNVVATRGGAVRFKRGGTIESLEMPAVDLVLTNTTIPRQTSQLVAGVAALKEKLPAIINPVIESIGTLCNEVYDLLKNPDSSTLVSNLARFASINHGLLVALGVSHPSLESVRSASTSSGLGETKLTGAGGGGCAITVVSNKSATADFKQKLPEMQVFETSIGGRGVGVARLEGNDYLENFASFPFNWVYYN